MNRRQRVTRIAFFIPLIAVVGLLAFGALQRPTLVISELNTPDDSHTVTVFGSVAAGQRLTARGGSLAAIRFLVNNTASLPAATPLLLHIRQAGDEADLRTVMTTLGEVRQATVLQYYDETDALNITAETLFFPFERVSTRPGQSYDIILEAPELGRQSALQLRYQIDDTKYPDGQIVYNQKPKEGDLGFVVYEQPTLATRLVRWFVYPDHREALAGLALIVIGLVSWWLARRNHWIPPTLAWWQEGWQSISWRPIITYSLILTAMMFIVYWPATRLFLFQDDLVKLARVKYFAADVPGWFTTIFTNHRYESPGNEFSGKVGFYRPISFSLYSWVLWLAFGLNPFPYHLLNIVLLAGIGVGLFILSVLLLRSYPLALLATSIWAFHSTKIPLPYWWSSDEDLIANFFIIITIVIYTRLRTAFHNRLLAALAAVYGLALFSKEHAVLLIVILPVLEFFLYQHRWRTFGKQVTSYLRIFSPLIILAGIYLIVRTAAIYDPTLPHYSQADHSYDLGFSPVILARSFIAYPGFTAEKWLWPAVPAPLQPLENILHSVMKDTSVAPPHYPGILLGAVYVLLVAVLWRKQRLRRILIFAGVWWVGMLLPNLLLVSVWSERWLTLSSWSLGLLTAVALMALSRNPAFRRSAALALTALVFVYGFWVARLPQRTDEIVLLSQATETALERFEAQESTITSETTIYFVGVPHDPRGSINAYLLRLFSDTDFKQVVYTPDLPDDSAAQVVIDMRDVFPQ